MAITGIRLRMLCTEPGLQANWHFFAHVIGRCPKLRGRGVIDAELLFAAFFALGVHAPERRMACAGALFGSLFASRWRAIGSR